MPTPVKFVGTDGKEYALDEILLLSMGGRLTVLQSSEHEVHEGHAFTFSTVDEDMDNLATLNVAFKTCHHKGDVYFYASFTALVGASLAIIEAPTWTTNTGTATSLYNRRRDTNPIHSSFEEDKTATPAFTTTDKLLVQVTGIAGGTTIWKRYAWGEKGKTEAGDYRAENEILLRIDTQYVVLFTAIGAANKGQIILNWLEHEVH